MLPQEKQELLWMKIIKVLYQMKEKSENAPSVRNRQELKKDFTQFFQQRVNVFVH
jgi:hypothetical protein